LGKENIKISSKDILGYYKQKKQVKLQWFEEPNIISGHNLNNVRCVARSISGIKRWNNSRPN
jgi:hypothetical protein